MALLPGVRSATTTTDRLRMHRIESGPPDGVPVVMVPGDLSTGRFSEYLLPGAPPRYRFLASDMRGFGDTEPAPIDAARGLRDWATTPRRWCTPSASTARCTWWACRPAARRTRWTGWWRR